MLPGAGPCDDRVRSARLMSAATTDRVRPANRVQVPLRHQETPGPTPERRGHSVLGSPASPPARPLCPGRTGSSRQSPMPTARPAGTPAIPARSAPGPRTVSGLRRSLRMRLPAPMDYPSCSSQPIGGCSPSQRVFGPRTHEPGSPLVVRARLSNLRTCSTALLWVCGLNEEAVSGRRRLLTGLRRRGTLETKPLRRPAKGHRRPMPLSSRIGPVQRRTARRVSPAP